MFITYMDMFKQTEGFLKATFISLAASELHLGNLSGYVFDPFPYEKYVRGYFWNYFSESVLLIFQNNISFMPGRVAQSVGHLTRKSGVLGEIPGLATYFRFSFRFFKKGSCQLLEKVCARSTG